MTKSQKIFAIVFLLVIAIIVYAEATKPAPISWFPSYTTTDKIPFGTYVFFDLFKDTLEAKIEEINVPPFEKLKDSTFSGTYFFVNNNVSFDKTEMELLLSWTEKGNTAFIAANYHSSALLDTLHLKEGTAFLFNNFNTESLLNLVNENLSEEKPFYLDKDVHITYFREIDTLKTTVLGVTQAFNDTLSITKPLINFVRIPFGKGKIYLHNQPEVFTNYFLLKDDNVKYTQNVLSYLDTDNTIYWDNYYKSGKKIAVSPLHVLFANKYLKWAYYFVLIGVFLFILFEGKRKQRPIPVIKPLTNKSYEYTQTIAGMYLDKKDHKEIAKKQILLFLEFIRTRLRLPTEKIDKRFIQSVASRSNSSEEDVTFIFSEIDRIHKKPQIPKEELEILYKNIKNFKTKLDGKSGN